MGYVFRILELRFILLKLRSNVSFQILVCPLTWVFYFHKSQFMSTSKLCVPIDVYFFFFCVSKVKNLQKLCQTHTLDATVPRPCARTLLVVLRFGRFSNKIVKLFTYACCGPNPSIEAAPSYKDLLRSIH